MFANCKEVPLQKQNIRSIISITPDRNTLIDTHERGDYMDKDTDYCVKRTEECKEELLHIISDINDAGTIEYLHTFIKLFMERWG